MSTVTLQREVGRAEVVGLATIGVMSLTPEQVGARIASAREEMKPKRWSQLDLAIALDVSPATIYRWEKAITMPSVTELVRVAETLGKPPDYLTEPPQRQVEIRDLLARLAELEAVVGRVLDLTQEGLASNDVRLSRIEERLTARDGLGRAE